MKTFEAYYGEACLMSDADLVQFSEQAVLEAMMSDFSDGDVYTEGVNLDAKKDFKKMKARVKDLKKELAAADRENRFKDAAETCDKIIKAVEDFEKKLNDNVGSYGSTILGGLLLGFGNLLILLLNFIPIAGPIASVILLTKRAASLTTGTIKKIMDDAKDDTLSIDSYNYYKNMLLASSTEVKNKFKKLKTAYLKESGNVVKESGEIDRGRFMESDDDYADLMEFIESADMDDPDQVELVESCLELMNEEADPDTVCALVGTGLVAAVCIAHAIASFRENSKYKNDPEIKKNLEKMKSLQKEVKSLGKVKIITPEISKKIRETNSEVKKLSSRISKREKEIDEALAEHREALDTVTNRSYRPRRDVETAREMDEWLAREQERQEAIKKAEAEERGRIKAREEAYRRIKAMNTHYDKTVIKTKEVNESVDLEKTRLSIYESAEAGIITDFEKNWLLGSLDM